MRTISKKLLALALALVLALSGSALAADVAQNLAIAQQLAEINLESNTATIKLLLKQCIDALGPDDPVTLTLNSIVTLLDTGSANGLVTVTLLKSAQEQLASSAPEAEPTEQEPTADEPTIDEPTIDEPTIDDPTIDDPTIDDPTIEEPTSQEPDTAQTAEPSGEALKPTYSPEELSTSQTGLPVYSASGYVNTMLQAVITMEVPGSWGNNAGASATMTSYSAVNGSGAVSPKGGTLTLKYYPMQYDSADAEFAAYARNLANMNEVEVTDSADVYAALMPGRKLEYTMHIGSNVYMCESVCFAYEGTVYSIELMQGARSKYDYFGTYRYVVNSAGVLDGAAPEIQDTPTVPDIPDGTDTLPEDMYEPFKGSWGDFIYQINGRTYAFPTSVRDIAPGDIAFDRSMTIDYTLIRGGTELDNSELIILEDSAYKEFASLTNMTGAPTSVENCVVTALTDTFGKCLNLTLPGDVRVGSPESAILTACPAYNYVPRNGDTRFMGNELCFACNVRDDGCTGYVLIRNDPPFYSTVSIICDAGIIKEISFECLGTKRAAYVFE